MSNQAKTRDPFIDRLIWLIDPERGDRGARAALRRYWSDTTRPTAYPILGRLDALGDTPKTLVAALYAEHPVDRKGIYLGKAARSLGKSQDGEHPYDRHFRRLLACDNIHELGGQLHRLVKRLAREGTGLDYQSLLIDLYVWSKAAEPEKREALKIRWAAAFWNAQLPEDRKEEKEVAL